MREEVLDLRSIGDLLDNSRAGGRERVISLIKDFADAAKVFSEAQIAARGKVDEQYVRSRVRGIDSSTHTAMSRIKVLINRLIDEIDQAGLELRQEIAAVDALEVPGQQAELTEKQQDQVMAQGA
jgi:hypothetical protein